MAFNAIHQVDRTVYPDTFTDSYFRNSYAYQWDDASLNSIKGLRLNLEATQAHDISFTVPQLWCWGCYNTGTATKLFEVNTVTTVRETKTLNGQVINTRIVVIKESGATNIPIINDIVFWSDGINAGLRGIKTWDENFAGSLYEFEKENRWINMPYIAKADESYVDKTINFTTTQLSSSDSANGYKLIYSIECVASPVNQNGLYSFYEKIHTGYSFSSSQVAVSYSETKDGEQLIISKETIKVVASFTCADQSEDASGGAFLMKGAKYNCYDLLRRALLTIDTHLIDNNTTGLDELDSNGELQPSLQHSIIVDPVWVSRLKTAVMQETIFEGKNLWEVLLQIGYYLHAIPYLEFATDGTDRFVLKFRQLGDVRQKPDTNTKITVFNSRNLSDYFSQYDSYVTNLFSPQNEIEEWLVPKTSDSSFLVSNDTAELQTARPILEIIEFDITYNGVTKDALTYIFESSVYQVLTSDNPVKISPAKGNAIYYTNGSNKIEGLNYTPPSVNQGDYSYALQEICRRLFGAEPPSIWDIPNANSLKFNDLIFHIKYRTQDSLRISQVRPDIENFVKNSEYEKYPHHEQFYGQQDKIIDSERFSANLFGKLVRVGNAIAQSQEYVSVGDEKETGDLVLIDVGNGKEPYYVTSIEAEYYAEAVLQKVSYSKNFNQLSQIVTIPSEPRFYEVSERSHIRREVRIMEFVELSTTPPLLESGDKATISDKHLRTLQAGSPRFMDSATMQNLLRTVIFAKENTFIHPNFAYSKFKADKKRQHKGSYGQFVDSDVLFPSSDIDRSNPNNITPLHPKSYADNITTVLHFPLHDGIVYEWDMVDNFSAGDFIDTEIKSPDNAPNKNAAYYAQQPVRYVDIMGRADLFEFKLINKTNWTKTEVQSMPKVLNVPADSDASMLTPVGLSIALDKDNREQLSFNYQINLVHSADRNIDDFLTFPNLFGQKDSDLRMCLLNQRQSMFNENIDLSGALIVADNVQYSLNNLTNALELAITPPTDLGDGYDIETYIDFVQAIVLYQVNEYGGRYAQIVKNVDRLDNDKKLQAWYFYAKYVEKVG